MPSPDFISEPITPTGEFRTDSAARGLVAVPGAFTWRGRTHRISEVIAREKFSSPEGGREGNEVYLRREYFTVRLDDGREAVIYFERQARPGAARAAARRRWFIYTITG